MTRHARHQPPPDWADRIERLEDRVADLTRTLAGRTWADGPVAGLSPQQTMIVALIAKRGRVSRQVMQDYLRNSGFAADEVWGAGLRRQIARSRDRLAGHAITITTLPGFGWQMDEMSRRIWARLAAPPVDLDVLVAATSGEVSP